MNSWKWWEWILLIALVSVGNSLHSGAAIRVFWCRYQVVDVRGWENVPRNPDRKMNHLNAIKMSLMATAT